MSEGKMKLNLKVEEQEKVLKMYGKALEDAKEETKKIIQKLSGYAEKEDYKVITDLTNALITFYKSKLISIMKDHYQSWEQSNASIHKQVEAAGAGETAIETAKSLEHKFEAKIDELFVDIPEELKLPNSNPNIETDVLDKIIDELQKYLSKIDSKGKNHDNKIANEADKNKLFAGIRPHVSATYSGIQSGFFNAISATQGISQELVTRMKAGMNDMDQANERASTNSAATAASQMADTFPKPFM